VGRTPLGVTVAAALTMLGAAGAFLFATVWTALGSMGHAGVYGSPPISYWLVLFSSLLLSGISFVASVGMFRGEWYIWHLSIAVWMYSAAHYCCLAWLMFRGENLTIMAGLAVFVNMALIAYFQSRQAKDYFLDHRHSQHATA